MELTLAQKIENLTWWNEIIKLKEILRALLGYTPTYKTYTALLTQSSTNAPTPTVIINTTGHTITWSYSGVGIYIGTFSGTINQNKLWFSATPSAKSPVHISVTYESENTISVNVYNTAGSATNNLLSKTPIEIKIFD